MSCRELTLVGAAVCSSLALGYLVGKFHGSRRYTDDYITYIQRPGREFKKTDGLKTFLDYVAKYSSPEHYLVTELRKVGKISCNIFSYDWLIFSVLTLSTVA